MVQRGEKLFHIFTMGLHGKKCVPYIYNGSAWKKCGS